jgi:hypothetical protein
MKQSRRSKKDRNIIKRLKNRVRRLTSKDRCLDVFGESDKQQTTTDMSDSSLFNLLNDEQKLLKMKNIMEYILHVYGTSEPCNRFDVGNSMEYLLCDLLTACGLSVDSLPNAKRVDLNIHGYGSLSVKYSSSGDITLHNSNSSVNTDENFTDTLLVTTDRIYLLTSRALLSNGIDIKQYLKNAGDSLKLKRKIITALKKVNYPYVIDFDLNINKKECKNKLTGRVFYEQAIMEYARAHVPVN